MNPGRFASHSLLALLTAIAVVVSAGVTWIPSVAALSPLERLGVSAVAVFVLFGTVLVPLGVALDQSIAALRRYIENATDTDQPVGFVGPTWLRPITRAFSGVVDQFLSRERALRSQLRELEIRHRVSEAERRQVEAVLHALRHPVIVTDAYNEIIMANEAAARVLGFEVAEAIHRPIDEVVVDERLRRLIDESREQGNFADYRHVEHELLVAPSGEQDSETPNRVYDVTLACVENHKSEVGGVITVLHDLTRERELSQMKTDFVSKASHELRTPLSSIHAYVEMLVDGEASDESARDEFYRIIQGETDRLSRLIDNMLNISRIEAGIVQVDREQVDLGQLIARAIETLEPQARDRQISLSAKTAAIDLSVEGDSDMLYQVVLNLGSNAVKYTPEGGRVTIGADTDNLTRCVVVRVSDTGLGIPPDAVPKLFDKFFRVENYKRIAKGTGLGLSLCKHIVESVHNGQIGVESKLGMGSRFWFSIPMRYAGCREAA